MTKTRVATKTKTRKGSASSTAATKNSQSSSTLDIPENVAQATSDTICGKCGLKVTDDEDSLDCDTCHVWYHTKCINMPQSLFSEICKSNPGEYGGVSWDCGPCRGSRSQLNSVLHKLDQLLLSNTELRKELNEEKQKRELLEKNLDTKIKELVNEEKEKERRATNIIIRGLEESKFEEREQAKEDDKVQVTKIINEIVPNIEIDQQMVDIFRIGVKNDKPRGIKLVMKRDSDIKDRIFKAKENRIKVQSTYPNLRFFPDRTKQEQQQYKILVEELKDRAKNGEVNLMIKDYKIVQKPPPRNQNRGYAAAAAAHASN